MDKILAFSKKIIKQKIDKKSIVVDATCGNGHDTLFLANTCSKKVYAFDIQEVAIKKTKLLLQEQGVDSKCDLILDSHSNIDKYIDEKVSCVMFNLGYLPGENHTITTLAKTTLVALKKCIKILKLNGIISIAIYWGHSEGKKEKEIVVNFLESLNQKYFEVLQYRFINQKNNAPFLVIIEKIKELDEDFYV